ncbi:MULTISPECIES: hypothetical protein [Flavobacterium]|uniref:Uncharacterized protein n=2 Tax=Flavobacterium TaxID=237 RepID=A0A941AXZ0_9FLAO|nr:MULTISPECIES: hypothetical protein [Flavobacterium]MBP4137127.1 hypothetical protein [Flavobacterium geliluteum]MDX6182916.1 hypothetical protein [Flavobacterium sp. Fl-33]MDX6186369.1 hypothetical protein [Flavobacterium sp. Fl-77]UFH37844.1 hypothetical protein LNP22_14000 [Flavobacterium sp. F-70]
MKKSKLLIVAIAIFALLFVSCHKGRKKLINSWKVTAVELKKPLSDSLKNLILSKGNLTFTEDGKVTGFLEHDMNGTFILSEGGKSLVLKDETQTPYKYVSDIEHEGLILDNPTMKITLTSK